MKPLYSETPERKLAGLRRDVEILKRRPAPVPLLFWGNPPPYVRLTETLLDLTFIGGAYGLVPTITPTVINNYNIHHASGFDQIPFGPFLLGPGFYVLRMNAQAGASYGTVAMYVAGAYPFTPSPSPPANSSADWIHFGTWDFSQNPLASCATYSGGAPFTYDPLLHDYTGYGCATSHPSGLTTGNAGFNIDRTAADEGFANLFNLSTAIAWNPPNGADLNGGAGYYFLRMDLNGLFDLSELVLFGGGR